MPSEIVPSSSAGAVTTGSAFILPAVIADWGDKAAERLFTFFTDTIPNKNTRSAYHRTRGSYLRLSHPCHRDPESRLFTSIPGSGTRRLHAASTDFAYAGARS